MKLLGFSFNKQCIEKFKDSVKDLKISANINMVDIHGVKSDSFKLKEEIVGVKFTYIIDYEPEMAKIEFAGSILFAVESKIAKEILNKWEEKQISEDFRMIVFNIIMKKANIKALQFEDEMNLPTHISLPILRKSENKDQ